MTGSLDHSTHADQEQLVAYMDGELTPAEAEQVERRLSVDGEFRQLLRSLQQAWDLLDELPQPTVDEDFTQTTVEMVAVRMTEASQQEQQRSRYRRAARRLAQLASLTACVLLGFLAVRHFQGRAEARFLNDLPVIERVDLYREIDDLAFLEALAAEDLFAEAPNEEPSSDTP